MRPPLGCLSEGRRWRRRRWIPTGGGSVTRRKTGKLGSGGGATGDCGDGGGVGAGSAGAPAAAGAGGGGGGAAAGAGELPQGGDGVVFLLRLELRLARAGDRRLL